tara:strand:+ start:1543 stop:2010 length:468 start_codon:yes stop_codon:yes gene_type:complete
MTLKSPCIDKCRLNPKNNLCDGCYRTSEEITNWTKYSSKERQKIFKALKLRKLKFLCFLFLFIFNDCFSNDLWIGKWIASDKWQSEFIIKINKDGSAETDYGNGDTGKWTITDGNLEISWESGKIDYLFRGVMGFQRISKKRGESYTSGMRKSLD